jgi:von Willebrand factor type A domain
MKLPCGGTASNGATGGTNGSGNNGTNGSTNGTNGSGTNGSSGSTTGSTGSTNGSTGSTTGSTGSTTGSTTGVMCTPQSFTLTHNQTPEVILVQDRSGSMMQDPDGGGGLGTTPDPTSKWVQMKNALEQVVSSTGAVEWGLELFPQVGQDNNDNGCAVGTALDVAVGLGRAPSINSVLDGVIPGGTTPTAAALDTAVRGFASSDGHPHYIVLATDGEPDCSVDAAMMDDPVVDASNAVTAAVAAGVHVFVVGIGTDPTDQMTLTNMANLGLEPNTKPGASAYYQVSTTSDLTGVLDQIAGQITDCGFALPSVPQNPDFVTLSSNGLTVARDPGHLDGWDFGPGDLSIVLYGNACNDTGTLTALFGCP